MLKIEAFAKINLILNILFKRADGYHELQSIMQSISLADTLTFLPDNEFKISCSDPTVPCDEKNTVARAAKLIKEKHGVTSGAHVHIEKRIPWGAGLAGGSADAAAALYGLNALWKLNLSDALLYEYGALIGSDVPFCMMGGTVLATGRGEILKKMKPLTQLKILLVVPPINVSTAWVYQQIPQTYWRKPEDLAQITTMERNLHNDLEQFTFTKYPEIKEIKQTFIEVGAKNSLMSGSGSAVFGLFDNEELCAKAYSYFKKKYNNTFQVDVVNKSCKLS